MGSLSNLCSISANMNKTSSVCIKMSVSPAVCAYSRHAVASPLSEVDSAVTQQVSRSCRASCCILGIAVVCVREMGITSCVCVREKWDYTMCVCEREMGLHHVCV